MKKLMILPLLAILSGCMQNGQGRVDDKSSRVCIDGVSYIYMPNSYGGSISPHLKPDGKPYTCNGDKQ